MNSAKQNNSAGRLSWRTRFAYGCGDTACNLVYGMMASVLTLFCTDYAGISAATVGLVMLLSRIFDGASDAVMGIIVERTHSKMGQIVPLAAVDVRAVCVKRSAAVCRPANERDRAVPLYVRDL